VSRSTHDGEACGGGGELEEEGPRVGVRLPQQRPQPPHLRAHNHTLVSPRQTLVIVHHVDDDNESKRDKTTTVDHITTTTTTTTPAPTTTTRAIQTAYHTIHAKRSVHSPARIRPCSRWHTPYGPPTHPGPDPSTLPDDAIRGVTCHSQRLPKEQSQKRENNSQYPCLWRHTLKIIQLMRRLSPPNSPATVSYRPYIPGAPGGRGP
jgi:hypothetical protein